MPKIPTFQARGDITTEAPTSRTGIQLSPTATPAAALIKPVTQIAEYYEREKLIVEKADADKQYLELTSELDEIEANSAKLFNPTEAERVFDTQSKFLVKQKIDSNKNKRVKRMMSDLFNQDIIIRKNNVKKLAREELDKQEEYNYKTKYEINLSKYNLATSQKDKNFYSSQIFSDQESRSLHFNDSQSTKEIAMDAIKKDLLVSDVDQLIKVNQYESAINILKDIDNTPFLDAEKRSELLDTITTKYNSDLSVQNIDNILDNKLGVYASGGQLKNVDGNVIKEKDLQEGMNRKAQSGNYTPPQIVELSISNNTEVPLYKSIINGGSANISDTGNKQLTKQGLEYYKLFKTQNGFNSLKSTYKIDKETLASYERMDFAINRMYETFDSVFAREVEIKNKPESYRLRTVDDTKIDSTFSKIDMPGFFLGDIQNVQTTKYLLKNIANIYYKAGGDQNNALSAAKQFIEQNYRMDLFQQIVPRDNSLPEYHDAAIKTYIKKIYDEGRINKEANELDDIIPVYYSLGEFSDVQGIILKNKTNDQAISIGASIPSGDFDEAIYDSARLTQKDIVEKIYPLEKDLIYAGNVKKYKLLQDKRNKLIELSKPLVESGFGKPIK